MEETKGEILKSLKLLLGISDSENDGLLELLIEDSIDATLAYCHLEELPRQLVSFIPLLAQKQYRKNVSGGIRAITEGERRVEYDDADYDFLAEYAARLKPFVSRSVKLPSDFRGDKNGKSV